MNINNMDLNIANRIQLKETSNLRATFLLSHLVLQLMEILLTLKKEKIY